MQGFTRLGELSSMATRSVEMRRLTDRQTHVYQCFIEKLGNGRVPQEIELVSIANRLGVTYKAARVARDALVKKGFLEFWTATHRDKKKGFGFRKTTYYRLKF